MTAALTVPDSLDNLLSTREAAELCGVEVATIRKWAHRDHLTPSDIDVAGRPLYKLIDVLRASRDTRERAIGKRRVR